MRNNPHRCVLLAIAPAADTGIAIFVKGELMHVGHARNDVDRDMWLQTAEEHIRPSIPAVLVWNRGFVIAGDSPKALRARNWYQTASWPHIGVLEGRWGGMREAAAEVRAIALGKWATLAQDVYDIIPRAAKIEVG